MRKLSNVGLAAAALVVVGLASGCAASGVGGAGLAADSAPPGTARAAVLIQSGITLAEQHNIAAAQNTFRQVLALEPDNKYAWFNLGVIAQGQNDTATAVTDYGRALQTDPSFTSALYNKAIALSASDPTQAEQLLQQAISADPKASTAYLNLGLLLQKTDPDGASAAFAKAIALDPSLSQFVPGDASDGSQSGK